MERYELEGFENDIKHTSAMLLKVIRDYVQNGDYHKRVVIDTVTEKKGNSTIKRNEPRVADLPCINLREVERAANIMKKLSKVVESTVKTINPDKHEWKKKSPWQEYRDNHPEYDYYQVKTYTLDEDGNPINPEPDPPCYCESEDLGNPKNTETEPENIQIQTNPGPIDESIKQEPGDFLSEFSEALESKNSYHKPSAA